MTEDIPKDLYQKREPDYKLWKRIGQLSDGTNSDKLQAIDLIMEYNHKLPLEADELLEQFAQDEDNAIRKHIAEKLKNPSNITIGLHLNLLNILTNDEDSDVSDIAIESTGVDIGEIIRIKDMIKQINIPTIPPDRKIYYREERSFCNGLVIYK